MDIVRKELEAAGLECESVGEVFLTVRFDGVRRCSNHGHLFDSLEVRLEGDCRAVTQPLYEGDEIGPDRVHECADGNVGDVVVSFVKGLTDLKRVRL